LPVHWVSTAAEPMTILQLADRDVQPLSAVTCGGVELGHELAVGGPGGAEFVVAFLTLEVQVGDLLLHVGDLVVEGVDVGGRAEAGLTPCLVVECLG
jgi:hypothetical protein